MNNLEKMLVKKSSESIKEGNELIGEAKQLLESKAANEVRTLKSIGLIAELEVAEEIKKDHVIRTSGKDKYGKEIIHIDQIDEICDKYRLWMRAPKFYKGRIPTTLAAELTKFCQERGIALSEHHDYSKFVIVAPPKMFKDYRPLKTIVNEELQNSVQDLSEGVERTMRNFVKSIEPDPVLLYQTEDPNYYAIVRSWGNDFMWLRRIYGFFTKPFFISLAKHLIWIGISALMIIAGVKLFTFMRSVIEGMETDWKAALSTIGVGVAELLLVASLIFWTFTNPFRVFRMNVAERITNTKRHRLRGLRTKYTLLDGRVRIDEDFNQANNNYTYSSVGLF